MLDEPGDLIVAHHMGASAPLRRQTAFQFMLLFGAPGVNHLKRGRSQKHQPVQAREQFGVRARQRGVHRAAPDAVRVLVSFQPIDRRLQRLGRLGRGADAPALKDHHLDRRRDHRPGLGRCGRIGGLIEAGRADRTAGLKVIQKAGAQGGVVRARRAAHSEQRMHRPGQFGAAWTGQIEVVQRQDRRAPSLPHQPIGQPRRQSGLARSLGAAKAKDQWSFARLNPAVHAGRDDVQRIGLHGVR